MRLFRLIFILVLCTSGCIAHASTVTQWKPLAAGLDYAVLHPMPNTTNYQLHAFRIDLDHYRLSLVVAKNINQTSLFTDQLAEEKKALLAINGGFFTPDMQPLGLRITQGRLLYPLKNTAWWGVLIVQNNQAKIVAQKDYQFSPKIGFAIQAGPRLIVNGRVPNLREGMAQRSAIGVTREGKVIIAITDNLPMSTTELATILQKPENEGGLSCYNALNLDGGSSSQLYAHVGDFTLHIRSIRPVSDVILVTKRLMKYPD